jgi:carbohydrate diacid regulator
LNQNKTVGAIGITGDLDDVQQFGDLLKMTAELMIKQSYVASQSEWRQRTIEETFEEIIKEQPNEEMIQQKLELLKIFLKAPFHLLLLEIESSNIKGQRQLFTRKIEDVFAKNRSLVGFVQVNKMFVLTSELSSETISKKANQILEIAKRFNIQCKIGIGTTAFEKSEIHLLYKEASLALLLNDKRGPAVTSFLQIETEAFIFEANSVLQRRFLNRTFPDISDKYVETLQTFFACNLNITDTANKLFIHRNTLIYRFKKVKEQTGYDPQIFHDAVTLQIANWIFKHKIEEKPN